LAAFQRAMARATALVKLSNQGVAYFVRIRVTRRAGRANAGRIGRQLLELFGAIHWQILKRVLWKRTWLLYSRINGAAKAKSAGVTPKQTNSAVIMPSP